MPRTGILQAQALADTYPERSRDRDRWIAARRPTRRRLDPRRPHACFLERERSDGGEIVPVATVLLVNRECPWRCVMCDLWKHTVAETLPPGLIPQQIDVALAHLAVSPLARPALTARGDAHPPVRHIKLYNAGSFFDPRAIPPTDHRAIADRVHGFDRVIVECHPALVGESCLRFRDLLVSAAAHRPAHPRPRIPIPGRPGSRPAKLEVAMGLETAHPQTLARLNKQMTVERFRRAAEFLQRHDVALRVFVLVKPPFLEEAGALHWARKSIDFAFDCGATAVSLIPTRGGNGALEALGARGEFSPPKLGTLEAALDYGIASQRGRVFADVWDLERFSACEGCFSARRARLGEMNLRQAVLPPVPCGLCSARSDAAGRHVDENGL